MCCLYLCRRENSVGRLSEPVEQSHEYFTELQSQANELDKQIEITQPLINLLDNMVTMGSLYGADNLLYAAEYKKVLEMLLLLIGLFIGRLDKRPRAAVLGPHVTHSLLPTPVLDVDRIFKFIFLSVYLSRA